MQNDRTWTGFVPKIYAKLYPAFRRKRVKRFLAVLQPKEGETVIDLGGEPATEPVDGLLDETIQDRGRRLDLVDQARYLAGERSDVLGVTGLVQHGHHRRGNLEVIAQS